MEMMQIMRRPLVEAMTGLSRSTIYAWMARGEFPQPIKLGAKAVGWRESDITAWLSSRELRAPNKVQQ
jgi:prophage regulatory protein